MLRTIALIFSFIFLAALPEQQPGKRVYDLADRLVPELESELEGDILAVEGETTAQLAVVTVHSLEGDNVDDYAYKLFNYWGIGQKDVNNGVLFLIAPNERRARIEVGYGLEDLITDGLAGELLDTYAIPRFKEGDFQKGIAETTRAILKLLREHPDAARGIPGSAPAYLLTPQRTSRLLVYIAIGVAILFFFFGMRLKRREQYSTLLFIMGNVLVIGVGAVAVLYYLKTHSGQVSGSLAGTAGTGLLSLFYNWRAFFRFGPHSCPRCRTKLVLMNEAKDDEKLSDVQKIEEQLGAVDYDVWVCPACLTTDIEKYVKWFSGFSDCPKCAHRTYNEKRTTIKSATRSSTGLARVTGNCASCKHTSTRQEVIPRITSSSGSSSGGGGGGSFGGGSSGGGGSSRGW